MSLVDIELASSANPVDLIEQIAASHDWAFDRSGDDEITISVTGAFCDYNLSMSWMGALEALHLACAFDFKVQERRKPEVMQLLALVNEQLWIGHFDLWQAEGVIMYRNALLLTEGIEAGTAQLEAMLVGRGRSLRALLSGFSVRHLGRQVARGSACRRAFRDARRSLIKHDCGRSAPSACWRRQDGRRDARSLACAWARRGGGHHPRSISRRRALVGACKGRRRDGAERG